jgi:hypothetical protein
MRIIDPTQDQIYTALVACGMVRTEHPPPDSFRNGTDVQRALHGSFYVNPRGAKCAPVKSAVHLCWKTTTGCLYARIIAIIYELANHVMTKESIEAIDISDFNSIYGELIRYTGDRWFGVYPLYENARIHIETFNHQCVVICPVANCHREIMSTTGEARDHLRGWTTDHMLMYKHPTVSGPPGRREGIPNVPRTGRPWGREAPVERSSASSFAPSSSFEGNSYERPQRGRRGFPSHPYDRSAHTLGGYMPAPDSTPNGNRAPVNMFRTSTQHSIVNNAGTLPAAPKDAPKPSQQSQPSESAPAAAPAAPAPANPGIAIVTIASATEVASDAQESTPVPKSDEVPKETAAPAPTKPTAADFPCISIKDSLADEKVCGSDPREQETRGIRKGNRRGRGRGRNPEQM